MDRGTYSIGEKGGEPGIGSPLIGGLDNCGGEALRWCAGGAEHEMRRSRPGTRTVAALAAAAHSERGCEH